MNNIFSDFLNLHTGEDDKDKTLENIKNNISFRGANLWILACAIIIASVGLNVNSTAVIIGAMLISPLMSPIVAAGFALGIYDFVLLKKALKNLIIATAVSLIVATLYFFISPFKEVQSELLARTSPNIYDILIAFFGGLVGVIAVTRVEKGNPIPGVAIATALMPPLCTAGYGLANGKFRFFFGAFFLYTINCVFICIATYIIVKFLKYPAKEDIDLKHQNRVKYGVTFLVVLMLLPSIYFAYRLYKQQQYKQTVDLFIEHEFIDKGNTIVYKKTNYNSNPKSIELIFYNKNYKDEEIKQLNSKLITYNLRNTKLVIKQDTNLNIQKLKGDILNEIKNGEIVMDGKDKKIQLLETDIANNNFDNKQLLKEVNAIFPNVQALSLANHTYYQTNDSLSTSTVLIYQSKKELNIVDIQKLKKWMVQRLSLTNLEIYKK